MVCNVWKEEDLIKDLPELKELNSKLILWPDERNKNIMHAVILFKLMHLKRQKPLFVSVKFVPNTIDLQDDNLVKMAIMTGWKFSEMSDVSKEAKFIGLISY